MCVRTLTDISTSTVVDMRRLSRGVCVDSAGFPGILLTSKLSNLTLALASAGVKICLANLAKDQNFL